MKLNQVLKTALCIVLCSVMLLSDSSAFVSIQAQTNGMEKEAETESRSDALQGDAAEDAAGTTESEEKVIDPTESEEKVIDPTERMEEETETETTELPIVPIEATEEPTENSSNLMNGETEPTENPVNDAENTEQNMESEDSTQFTEDTQDNEVTDAMVEGTELPLEDDSSFKRAGVSDGYYVLEVKQSAIVGGDAYRAVQDALDEAHTNATDEMPYMIKIEPGSYVLSKSLHIYSNTYLYMNNVTLTQQKGNSTNMMKVGDSEDVQSGYYYKNITMEGGVWDANGNSNTTIKVGHAANFAMINQTVQNVKNAHLMEAAGIDGMTVKGCTFKDQLLTKNSDTLYYEALQIDVLLKEHIVGFLSEDIPMKNIVIDACNFSNVPRAVGSHSAILNSYVQNISITNSSFSDIKSAAIQGMNWMNCTISGNNITNSPRGIAIYSIRDEGTFLASTAAKQGGIASDTPTGYIVPPANQNINIQNNNISCLGSDPYANYEDTGILVGGVLYNNAHKGADGDKIPAGDYYLSGVTISNNVINTIGHGIRAEDTKNSVISNNTITYTAGSSKIPYYGIQLREASTNNSITENDINSPYTNGIFVYSGSSAQTISNNTILSAGKYGIDIENATAETISGNTVSSSKSSGIYVYNGAAVTNISSNNITKSGAVGINIDKASVENILSNTVSTVETNGIYLHNKASAINISDNSLTEIKKHAIFSEESTIGNISRNNIPSPKVNGIYIFNKSKVSAIDGNKVSSAGKYGIDVENSTVSAIENNNISKPANHGIVVQKSGKIKTIHGNTISSGNKNGIILNSTKSSTTISSNKVTKCKKDLIYIKAASTSYKFTLKDNVLSGTSKINGIYVEKGKVAISDNTIKSCKRPLVLTNDVKGTVNYNKYSKNKSNTAQIGSAQYKNLSKPTSVKASKAGKNKINLSWKKSSNVSGYVVYRSTKPKSGFKKCGTVSGSTKYTDKNVKSGKTYYYKIAAYKKSSNKKITIYSDYSKVVSKKL